MVIFNLKKNKKTRKNLRKKMTRAEIVLWKKIRSKRLGYKFRRQFGIGPYITDFYCPQLKFAIELDGDVHTFNNVRCKDAVRNRFLKEFGITTKRYWNSYILNNLDSVVEDIYNTCTQLSKLKQNENVKPLKSPPKIRGRLQRGLI
jgi:very-short-patch-repair endonuclease